MEARILRLALRIDNASLDHCSAQGVRDDISVIPRLAFLVWKDEAQLALWAGQPPFLQCVHDEWPQRDSALASFGFGLADLAIAVHPLPDMKLAILQINVDPAQAAQL